NNSRGVTKGAVYLYEIAGAMPSLSEQFFSYNDNPGSDVISDGSMGSSFDDFFGSSVQLNGSGSILAIAAEQQPSLGPGINSSDEDLRRNTSGAVYIFDKENSHWKRQTFIKSSNTGAFDFFGKSIQLSDDGETLLVTAHNEDSSSEGVMANNPDDNSSVDSGSAYVFDYVEGEWQQSYYVKPPKVSTFLRFGFSSSMSADGERFVISSIGDDSGSQTINGDDTDTKGINSGSVRAY
ncbi:hypothetical protein ACFLJY_003568, partial [Vibrio alginolyticus]